MNDAAVEAARTPPWRQPFQPSAPPSRALCGSHSRTNRSPGPSSRWRRSRNCGHQERIAPFDLRHMRERLARAQNAVADRRFRALVALNASAAAKAIIRPILPDMTLPSKPGQAECDSPTRGERAALYWVASGPPVASTTESNARYSIQCAYPVLHAAPSRLFPDERNHRLNALAGLHIGEDGGALLAHPPGGVPSRRARRRHGGKSIWLIANRSISRD